MRTRWKNGRGNWKKIKLGAPMQLEPISGENGKLLAQVLCITPIVERSEPGIPNSAAVNFVVTLSGIILKYYVANEDRGVSIFP